MITRQNYFDFARNNNLVGRFPEFKEFHEFVNDATQGGKDWSPYTDEPETKQFIDAYFDKLNSKKLFSHKEEQRSSSNSHSDPPTQQQQHSGGGKQKRVHKKNAGTGKKTNYNKPGRKVGSSAKEKKHKQVLNLPKGKLVELVDPHLLFVGRYLRMNDQKRSRNALEKFFAQINQAADARLIRKASPYAAHVIYIQKHLLKLLQTDQSEMLVEIPTAKFNELLRAVAKEQQMTSVRLLKRYHNVAGRPVSIEKARKLYNEMYNAIEKGKIPENDRLFKRIAKAMRDLTEYVKADDASAELVRLPAELNGILGYMDGCLCRKDQEMSFAHHPSDVEVRF